MPRKLRRNLYGGRLTPRTRIPTRAAHVNVRGSLWVELADGDGYLESTIKVGTTPLAEEKPVLPVESQLEQPWTLPR